ncbi:ABC transporter substrate-binding protein [Actinophytocola algeriensis]|uniref:NitT/TauT family transport system substrate-binding protein n=1 Tax=Actinophytocola algeriensis TaxID=1768010 RepID=A0A7W7Q5W6_9PSEU|nr:ABC transporter substrate-binding protein [Actinophytocola algeriensis]MBB4907388.1 NitT/TauT family transport system substrate-binding protein [Actinophytocola algeriensis]MBE1478871.1 NitT/TauT family transport system substrate-binding protein [Actinophytocola algeriensis]
MATLLAASLTAGCGLFGGSDEAGDSGDGTTAASGPLEKTTLKVGVMIGIDCAGAQLALLNDTFADEGLKIEATTIQSGALAIPSLASGEFDITFGNWVSFIKAQSAGVVDMKFIGESYLSTPNSNFAVIAGKDSPINSPKDLEGKKIAVNAKGNINELLLRAVLTANDVDFNKVKDNLVEMPFPNMAAAVQNKQVDAAAFIDPFVTAAQKEFGHKIVFDLTGAGPTENFPLSGFATKKDFAEQNPNTIAAFQRALLKGQQLAADRSKVEEALPKFAKMDPETAAIVKIGQFPTTIDAKRLQRVADLLVTYDMLEKKLDVEPLVVSMPSENG